MNVLVLLTLIRLVLSLSSIDFERRVGFNSSSLFANSLVRTFESREQLLKSLFWSHLTNKKYLISIRNAVIFIEDEKMFLLYDEGDQEKNSLLWIPWINRNVLHLTITELDFGDDIYWLGSENFPLLTVSAEFSTSSVQVEREIVHGHSIRFNPSLLRLLGLLVAGWRVVLESTNSLYIAEKESLICRASPGGRVQLQISSKMLSFPAAKSRVVTYNTRTKQFENEVWKSVSSTICDEEHEGFLMFLPSSISSGRCITNETMFESQHLRRLLEHRIAFPKE